MKLRRERHFGDRIVSCYEARPRNIWDMVSRPVRETPAAEAIVDGSRRYTYGQLREHVEVLSVNFQLRGVAPGERVATLMANRAEFIFVLLACARIGAIVVPMGTRLKAPEIGHILNDCEARVVLHEASLADVLPPCNEASAPIERFAIGGTAEGSRDFAELMSPQTAREAPVVDEESIYCISYTSGTTGKPKGALLTHLGMVHACMTYRAVLGLQGPERAILATPGNHVGGAGIIMPILDLGGCIVLMTEFKARQFLQLVEAEKMTYGGGVPAMYNLMLLDPDFAKYDLSSWRWAFYSAAPMPEATIRAFAAACPGMQLINCYGSTEATTAMTMMPPGLGLDRANSVGLRAPCVDVVVVDDDEKEIQNGKAGELLIAGPTVVPGYWRNPEATAASFVGGYWRSGDIGSVDDEGFFRIHDRKKHMINRGGLKIFAAEVENVLSDHPAVIEAAVVGRPDVVLGERVHAFIVAKSEDLREQDVVAFCAERLADYKVPEGVTILLEALPRNQTGKILRPALVALLQSRNGS